MKARRGRSAAGHDPGRSYDAVADEYTRRIADELDDKPFDRELLDRFAERVRGLGPVADVGCGPGHVARYLHERGVRVEGVDLSRAMVAQARRLNPGLRFVQGDMAALDAADGAWAAAVAFYSIIHVPREQVGRVLLELRRVLRPGGLLLLAFHLGESAEHLDDWWGRAVSLDFFFFTTDELTDELRAAGFAVEAAEERDPYPEVEAPTRRGYLLARAPSE